MLLRKNESSLGKNSFTEGFLFKQVEIQLVKGKFTRQNSDTKFSQQSRLEANWKSRLEGKDNTVLEEVRKLNGSISKLHTELAVTKNVDNLLLTRLTTLERQCWANFQYSRRECLDIVGIPSEVSGEVLQEKALNIFGKLGCDISPDHIEACHRVGKTNDTVIVKFFRRKDCQHIWNVKKGLKKLNMEDIELPGNSKLFINRRLCPYYKMLWSKSKKLHSLSKIHSFFISGDTIKIKVSEYSSPLSITHVDDLGKHFPDVDLSPPPLTS